LGLTRGAGAGAAVAVNAKHKWEVPEVHGLGSMTVKVRPNLLQLRPNLPPSLHHPDVKTNQKKRLPLARTLDPNALAERAARAGRRCSCIRRCRPR